MESGRSDCIGKLVDNTAFLRRDSKGDEPIFDERVGDDMVRAIFGATFTKVTNLSGFIIECVIDEEAFGSPLGTDEATRCILDEDVVKIDPFRDEGSGRFSGEDGFVAWFSG